MHSYGVLSGQTHVIKELELLDEDCPCSSSTYSDNGHPFMIIPLLKWAPSASFPREQS